MARKCVICNVERSELRESIEGLIDDGGSYVEAAKMANDNGLDVSHTSVQRHIES